MLKKEEKIYIRKVLLEKLKLLRYAIYALAIIVAFHTFLNRLSFGTLDALVFSFGIAVYILFILGIFYLFIELISGNQFFKFIMGNYTVYREIVYKKYQERKFVQDTFHSSSMHIHRQTYRNYFDTAQHTKVVVIDKKSYYKVELGDTAIIIQFGKNKENAIAVFIPKEEK